MASGHEKHECGIRPPPRPTRPSRLFDLGILALGVGLTGLKVAALMGWLAG